MTTGPFAERRNGGTLDMAGPAPSAAPDKIDGTVTQRRSITDANIAMVARRLRGLVTCSEVTR
jgi:hypothetical protein